VTIDVLREGQPRTVELVLASNVAP
jgi:hypothetical protein